MARLTKENRQILETIQKLMKNSNMDTKAFLTGKEETFREINEREHKFFEESKDMYEDFKNEMGFNISEAVKRSKRLVGATAHSLKSSFDALLGEKGLMKVVKAANKEIVKDNAKNLINSANVLKELKTSLQKTSKDAGKKFEDIYKSWGNNFEQFSEQATATFQAAIEKGDITSKRDILSVAKRIESDYLQKVGMAANERVIDLMGNTGKDLEKTITGFGGSKASITKVKNAVLKQMDEDFAKIQESYKKLGITLDEKVLGDMRDNLNREKEKIKTAKGADLKGLIGDIGSREKTMAGARQSIFSTKSLSATLEKNFGGAMSKAFGPEALGKIFSGVGKKLGPMLTKSFAGAIAKFGGWAAVLTALASVVHKYVLGGGLAEISKQQSENLSKMGIARFSKDIQNMSGQYGDLQKKFVGAASAQLSLMGKQVESNSDLIFGMGEDERNEFLKGLSETGQTYQSFLKQNNQAIQDVQSGMSMSTTSLQGAQTSINRSITDFGNVANQEIMDKTKAIMGVYHGVAQDLGTSAGELYKETRNVSVSLNQSQDYVLGQLAGVKDIWEQNRDTLGVDFTTFKEIVDDNAESFMNLGKNTVYNAKIYKTYSESLKMGKKNLENFYKGLQDFFNKGSAQEKLKAGLLAAQGLTGTQRKELVTADVLQQISKFVASSPEEAAKMGGITADQLTAIQAMAQSGNQQGVSDILGKLAQNENTSEELKFLIQNATPALSGGTSEFAAYTAFTGGAGIKQIGAAAALRPFTGVNVLGPAFTSQLMSESSLGVTPEQYLAAQQMANNPAAFQKMYKAATSYGGTETLKTGEMAVKKSIENVTAVQAASTDMVDKMSTSLQNTAKQADIVAKSFSSLTGVVNAATRSITGYTTSGASIGESK